VISGAIVSTLLVALTFPACTRASTAQNGLQAGLDSLSRQIDSGLVESVDVLYFPRLAEVRVGFSSERLKTNYRYKITIRELYLSDEAPRLSAALKSTSVGATKTPADLRFGLIFKLRGGAAREVHLDGFGRLGEIDGMRATLQGGMYGWLIRLTATLEP
jgi:hypothetical protein